MATEVANFQRDMQPYSNIGILWVTYPDGFQARGTASVVGRNDILTATHVVYAPDHGGWASDMDFYFGADFNDLTNNFEDTGYSYEPNRWEVSGYPDQVFTDFNNLTVIKSEAQYDIAIIGVDAPIGDDLGWLGLDGSFGGSFAANAVGYPAGQPGMMQESVFVTEDPNFFTFNSFFDVLGSGSSGGPLLIDDTIIGVKSTGSWWADISLSFENIVSFMAENDALLATLDPLVDPNPIPVDNPPSGKTGDPLDSPMSLQSGKSGENTTLSGGNNIDIVTYLVPYSDVSSISHIKEGSWTAEYNFTPTNGEKNGSGNASKVTDTLHDIERLKFSDDTYIALDIITPNEPAGAALALLYAGFNAIPDPDPFGHWIAKADQINNSPIFDNADVENLAHAMLKEFVPTGISNSNLVSVLYTNVVGQTPDQSDLDFYTQLIDNGSFSQASLFAFAAESNLNTEHYATLIGNGLPYEPELGKSG